MQASVRETSIAAYHELRDDGKLTAKQQQIIDHLHRHPGAVFSRLEISRAIDMPINCVAGRVNELLEKGVIEEADQRPCRISGRRINPIRLKQGRLL
jgi:hypothetical protein